MVVLWGKAFFYGRVTPVAPDGAMPFATSCFRYASFFACASFAFLLKIFLV
jgi:hypothetical protein